MRILANKSNQSDTYWRAIANCAPVAIVEIVQVMHAHVRFRVVYEEAGAVNKTVEIGAFERMCAGGDLPEVLR